MKTNYEVKRISYIREGKVIKYYRISANGKVTYYTRYEKLGDGFYKVMKNGRWGILNPWGTVWGNIEYTKIYSKFHEGIIRVQKNEKLGFADKETGRFIECVFEQAEDFKNSTSLVVYKGDARKINALGKFID